MRMMTSNRRFGQIWLVLLMLSSSIDGSSALVRGQRKELGIQSSRRLQDNMANKEQVPTESPTAEPTPEPTKEPKKEETKSPTPWPEPQTTSAPTASVVAQITDKPVPAQTAPPTAKPTLSVSVPPINTPTSQPTMSPIVVPFPGLQFTLQFIPQSEPDVFVIEQKIETFLKEFLIKQYEDIFVSLIITSDFNYNKESGMAVISTGGSVVFEGKDQPDSQVLKEGLITLFSYWGATDLQSSIDEAGYPILKFEVSIDGESVTNSAMSPSSSPASESSTGKGLYPGLIAGVAAAGIACILAAWAAHRRLRGSHKQNDQVVVIPAIDDFDTPPQTPNLKRSIRKTIIKRNEKHVEQPLELSERELERDEVMSNDDSVFTSGDAEDSMPVSEIDYDLGRLNFVVCGSTDEAPPTPKSSNTSWRW